MSTVSHEIAVTPRTECGKGPSRRARHQKLVPVVVYSKGKESKNFFLQAKEWEVLSKHDFNLLTLIDGKNKISAIVKEVQVNYMKSYVIHIDFQEVNMTEELHSSVSIHALPGDPAALSVGGILEQSLHTIEVACLPNKLPEAIFVDISQLAMGHAMHVKDLVMPEGVRALTDPDALVYHIMKQAAAASEEATAATVAVAAAATTTTEAKK
ncbi:MAG: 50S ribosomal protein L25 [Victivallaceae bacterium]